ncbi:transporter, LysE family protein [Shewanella benthica KT99]|uniref:Transporter, LysE family protein n=1 Tax=Shewanella benthica KT99 TaxID=314608 RepID=A9DFJ7_9GAMM|nr:transporter, LysE family protein [Shewanella benthica KT99]
MVLAIGLGMSALFQTYPVIHLVIKYIGIAYLLYLSWLIATSSSKMEGKQTSDPLSFIQAAAFQWIILIPHYPPPSIDYRGCFPQRRL